MTVSNTIAQLTDEDLGHVLEAERGALVLTRSDCGHCARYQMELESLLQRGKLDGVAVGKLALDERGATRFKRDNPWISGLDVLPYTVIYHNGERADAFAVSRGFYLVERLEDARAARL